MRRLVVGPQQNSVLDRLKDILFAMPSAIIICLLALAIPLSAQVTGESVHALSTAYPHVQWDSSAVKADFNGDGQTDFAHLGRANGRIFVGIVLGGSSRVESLDFAISAAEQRAICSEPATLVMESSDYDPAADIGPLPGFRRSKTTKGLRLSDGECDSIHLYWDHALDHMAWWRR